MTPSLAQSTDRAALISRMRERARFLRDEVWKRNRRTLRAGAALSSADIVAVLFCHALKIDPQHPTREDRDIFINARGLGVKFKRLGIPDQFVEDVGDYTETRATIGLTANSVARAITELLRS